MKAIQKLFTDTLNVVAVILCTFILGMAAPLFTVLTICVLSSATLVQCVETVPFMLMVTISLVIAAIWMNEYVKGNIENTL